MDGGAWGGVYSPWGCKESDVTGQLSAHTHTHIHTHAHTHTHTHTHTRYLRAWGIDWCFPKVPNHSRPALQVSRERDWV